MVLDDLYASVIRYCSDFGSLNNLKFVNFDAVADETMLPTEDVVGLSGFAANSFSGLQSVQVMIGVSLVDDTNLFRTISLISKIYNDLQPGKRIRVYNADTGASRGWFTVEEGTQVMPVGGTTARAVQFVAVTMGTDCYATP